MRKVFVVVALFAVGFLLTACGSKSEDTSTNAATTLPAEEISATDGAKAHSEADVTECSTLNFKGDVGTVAFGGFQDISVVGVSCEDARPLIVAAFKDIGTKASSPSGDYTCTVIEKLKGGLNTVRCVASTGSFRFTSVPNKRRVEIAAECGTFGRFYDVTALGQSCQDVATFLDNTDPAKFTNIAEGSSAKVGSDSCKTLYTENKHKTIHCDQGTKSSRFTIAEKESTKHPKHYAEKPSNASKPGGGHSPNVVISCSAVGPFDAITAKGVDCGSVSSLLQQNASALQKLKPGGSSLSISGFTCTRIDSGGQTATDHCVDPSGESFRASFIPPTAPAPTVPPATTSSSPAPESSVPSDSGGNGSAGSGADNGSAGSSGTGSP